MWKYSFIEDGESLVSLFFVRNAISDELNFFFILLFAVLPVGFFHSAYAIK